MCAVSLKFHDTINLSRERAQAKNIIKNYFTVIFHEYNFHARSEVAKKI